MEHVKKIVNSLPDKKRYAELITAVLSVPVLITVLLLNIINLNRDSSPPESLANAKSQNSAPIIPSPTSAASPRPSPSISSSPAPTTSPAQCVQRVGPVSITSPKEGAQITTDPVCLDISREASNYCSIVWSYRVNGGAWSDYMDKSICLYNLSAGAKNIEVKIKSIVGTEEVVLSRNVSVVSGPSQTPTASPSAQPL